MTIRPINIQQRAMERNLEKDAPTKGPSVVAELAKMAFLALVAPKAALAAPVLGDTTKQAYSPEINRSVGSLLASQAA